ncbi:MAG TPA: DNA primase, partial [Microvirga sp.]|nr:DNA primase [Microvirga sp.]
RLSTLGPEPRGGRFARGGRAGAPGRERRGAGAAPGRLSASPLLARSALFIGGPAETPREAMILCAVLVHPELLHALAETLAELDLESRSAQALRGLLLDGAASGEAPDPAVLQARLERAGLAEAAARLQALVRHGDRWVLDPHADPVRLEDALRQAITLHRRARTLHTELRAAERALAEEDNEANLAWLREVQNQLSSMAGAEADLDDSVVHRDP